MANIPPEINPLALTVSRAATFPQYTEGNAPLTSLAATWVNVGDLAICVSGVFDGAGTVQATVTSSLVTWSRAVRYVTTTVGTTYEIWTGVVTTTGADTIHVSYSPAPSSGWNCLLADELTWSGSDAVTWKTMSSGGSYASGLSSTVTWPSLTSGAAATLPEFYWGYSLCGAGAAAAGSTPGFNYFVTGSTNVVVFNPNLAASTAYAPTCGVQNGGHTNAVGMIVQASYPKINTQTNDFSQALATPPWGYSLANGGTEAVTGGQLVLTVPANTVSANASVVTWDGVQQIYLYFDLTESNYVVNLVNAGTQDPNVEVWAPQLVDINGNWYGWHIINGNIQVDNEGTILKSAAYSASTYAWLKIREHAGTTYFDYSSNGNIWTNFYSTADLYSVIAVRPNLYLGTNTPGTNAAATATFDNVNLAPLPTVTFRPSTNLYVTPVNPKIATLTDNFSTPASGTPDPTKWNTTVGGYAVNSGGQLVCTFPNGATNSVAQLYSGSGGRQQYYDLTESAAVIQVVNAGPAGQSGVAGTPQLQPLVLQNPWNNGYCQYYISNGNMIIQVIPGIGQGASTLWSGPWNGTNYQWLRVREHAGTVYFDYSADGSIWSNFTSCPDFFGIQVVQQWVEFSLQGTTTAQAQMVVDNVNLPPAPAVSMASTAKLVVYPVGPKMETLTDNFNTGTSPDPTKWINGAGQTLTLVNGQLNMPMPANAAGINSINAGYSLSHRSYYDLRESYALAQVVNPGDQSLSSANGGNAFLFILYDPTIGASRLYFNIANNVITCYGYPNGNFAQVWSGPYNPVNHQWLRIRNHAGVSYFDASPDGNIWTNLGSCQDTNPWLTALNPQLQVGLSATTLPAYTAIVDNYNLAPANVVAMSGTSGMLVGKSPNKLETLVDAFPQPGGPASIDPTKWWVQANQSTDIGISIPSGHLMIQTEAGVTTYSQLHAGVSGLDSFWDLTESQAIIQLLTAGNQSLASLEIYPLFLTDEDYVSRPNKLFWYLNTGGLYAFQWVNGTQTQLAEVTYSSTAHQWLKIREHAGTCYFDYSADGLVWKNLTSTPTINNAGSLACWVQCGTYNAEATGSTTTFDNFNVVTPLFSGAGGYLAATSTLFAAPYIVQFAGVAKLTVAGLVTEISGMSMAASSAMTVVGLVTQRATTTQTGVAALSVAGSQQTYTTIAQAANTTMTLAGSQTSVNAMPMAATAGMTVAASVKELASVTLAGGAALSMTAIRTVLGTVTETGTTTLAVATTSQQNASFSAMVNGNLAITGAGTGIANIYMNPVSTLTVAATVKEIATVPLAGNVSLTIGAISQQNASVTMTGVAAMTTTGARVLVGTVSFVSTTSLSVPGFTIEQGGVVMAATTTLAAVPGVQQIAVASLLGQASMAVATAPLWQGQAIMSATAHMTVSSVVLTGSSVLELATAGMVVAGTVRQVASILEIGTAGMTVTGAPIIEHASVALQGAAGMTVAAVVYTSSSVAMSATAHLTASSLSHLAGSIAMSALASMTVTGERQRQGAIVLSGSSNVIVSGQAHQFASVALAGSGGLTVTGVITRWGSVSLSAHGALIVAAITRVTGIVTMRTTASLVVAGIPVHLGTVRFVETSSLQTTGQIIVPSGLVALTGNAGMTVAANPVHIFAQVAEVASTSLVVSGQAILVFMVASSHLMTTPMVQQMATVLLEADGDLDLIGDLVIGDAIDMSSSSTMIVFAVAHGTSPFDWPDLADQMAKYGQLDPLMAGAQAAIDDVFPLRLPGPSN